MNRLNRGQQCIVYNILSRMMNNERFDIFLSGGSGVGKSRVLQAVYQTLCRMLNSKEDPKNNRVVVGAYTGKAAYNVGGLTLHTLFHLPTKCGGHIPPLSSAILTKCKKTYGFTLLFIIDEISLVGSKVFGWIISRVNQMTEVQESGKLYVSFLVVGDFAQLKPVHDHWIFNSRGHTNPLANILGNPHWLNFKLYELNEIMRQRDDKKFAETLRVIGDLGIEFCTEEQIALLDTRVITSSEPLKEIPDDAIILTLRNKDVLSFNEQRILACGQEIIENKACDYAEGRDSKAEVATKMADSSRFSPLDETQNLPGRLLLVIGKKYLLTSNLRTSDGLAHGNIGRLMKIIYHKGQNKPHRTLVKRVYLHFEDSSIGTRTRHENKHASKDHVDDDHNWTVIEVKDVTIKHPKIGKFEFHINRVQFPLIESEAMTIHKSQGQTYSKVAVNIGDDYLTQALMYVALSRATSLEGLYLFGRKSILKEKKSRRALELLKISRQQTATKKELTRLREESMMENLFPFLFSGTFFFYIYQINLFEKEYNSVFVYKGIELNAENPYEGRAIERPALSIMFANIQQLTRYKRSAIETDYGYQSCDIILLSECHTNVETCRQNFQIKGYRMMSVTGNRKPAGSNGQVGYWRTESGSSGLLTFIDHNADRYTHNYNEEYNDQRGNSTTKDMVEITMYEYKDHASGKTIYLIQIYNHPDSSENKNMDNLITAFRKFRDAHQRSLSMPLLLFGDFNIDFNITKNRERWDNYFGHEFGLVPTIKNTCTRPRPSEMTDPKKQRQLDWVFSNNPPESQETRKYSTWFSDHLPLYTAINFEFL